MTSHARAAQAAAPRLAPAQDAPRPKQAAKARPTAGHLRDPRVHLGAALLVGVPALLGLFLWFLQSQGAPPKRPPEVRPLHGSAHLPTEPQAAQAAQPSPSPTDEAARPSQAAEPSAEQGGQGVAGAPLEAAAGERALGEPGGKPKGHAGKAKPPKAEAPAPAEPQPKPLASPYKPVPD